MARACRLLKIVVTTLCFAVTQPALAQTPPCRIAMLGDSLTAGYGVDLADALPVTIEAALKAKGFACTVADAGVSGDTTAGGASRLAWVLADKPTHLVVELGGNDALRAIPPEEVRKNLDAILAGARAANVPAFLAGMLAPPNLGSAYGREFRAVYTDLAGQYELPLYPFLLDGAVGDGALMQRDGIHPNKAGVAVIVARLVPPLIAWLAATGVGAGAATAP